MKIELEPKRVITHLLRIILMLLAANILALVLRYYFQMENWKDVFNLFEFDQERNIPTLYSSAALLISSALLAAIAAAHKKSGESHLPWLGLAFIFLFLAVDETATLHEQISAYIQLLFQPSGVFFGAWMIPYVVALIALLGIYFRFLARLPKRIMLLMLISGALFVIGAIGLEAIDSYFNDYFPAIEQRVGVFLATFEESLEMLGVALFIYSLLDYIQTQFGQLKLETANNHEASR